MKQLVLNLPSTDLPTLDNFVPGRNRELLHTLRQDAAGMLSERFLYVWGAAGSGCTHLLRATVDAVLRDGGRACYVTAPTEQAEPDMVALDDVERLDATGQIALFDLYNRLREGSGRLLVAGTQPPARLKVRPDLATRLGWGLVFQVHPLDDAEKAAALASHAHARGFDLPHEVSDYLLRHWRRDLPSLLAVLDALDGHSLQVKRPVTVPLLREVLEGLAVGE